MAPENENNSWDELVDSLALPQENEGDSPEESSSSEEEASSDGVVGDITTNVSEVSREETPETGSEDSGEGEPEDVSSADDQAGEGESAEDSGEAEVEAEVEAEEEAEEVQVAENTDSTGGWDSLASEFGLESESPVVTDAAENDRAEKDEEGTSGDAHISEQDTDDAERKIESSEPETQNDEVPADQSEGKASWDELATSFGLEPEPDVAEATAPDGEVAAEDSIVQADSAPENESNDNTGSPSEDDNATRAGDEQELGSALEAASTEDETAKAIDDLFASFQPSANEAEEILADVESVVEEDVETESLSDSGNDNSQSLDAREEASSEEPGEKAIIETKQEKERPKPSRKKRRGNKPETNVAETDDNSASEDSDTEKRRNIPTWDDTIDDLIESNIARHKNSSRGRGPSRRKG